MTEEEKEEVRALTRGLHEAIQDANAAAAKLRAERRQIESTVAESVANLLDNGRRLAVEEIQDVLDKTMDNIRMTVATAAGAKSPEEFFQVVAEQVIFGIRPLVDSAVERVLARQHQTAVQERKQNRKKKGRDSKWGSSDASRIVFTAGAASVHSTTADSINTSTAHGVMRKA
jgi:hypothetical protein